jgi:hypothetical protein
MVKKSPKFKKGSPQALLHFSLPPLSEEAAESLSNAINEGRCATDMVGKNIIGTISIPADVDTGEEKLQDGTIVKWQVIKRGDLADSEGQRGFSSRSKKTSSTLKKKVPLPQE